MALSLPKLSEVGWTRAIAGAAIGIVAFFMVLLNTTGAWIASHNVFYTGAIAGVEILDVIVLVLVLSAPTLARKIVGAVVFAAIIYVCVENGKMSIQASFKDIFKDETGQTLSAAALRDKAKIADTDATALTSQAPADRRAVSDEIAELEVFRKKMAAQTTEGIKAAQSEMIPRCGYEGKVDGIRSVLTESAMRSCGEQIRDRLLVLEQKADAKVAPSSTKSNEAIDFRAKADEIDSRTIWLNLLLFAIAGITAAGYWAFVIWDDNRKAEVKVDPDVFRDLQARSDELTRRKANIDEGVDRAIKTKTRKKNRKQALKMLEDQRTELAKRNADARQKIDDAIAAMTPEEDEEETESEADASPVEALAPTPEPAVAADEPAAEGELPVEDNQPDEQPADSELLLNEVAAGDPGDEVLADEEELEADNDDSPPYANQKLLPAAE